jgi:type I restriction enzyme S subunit
LYYCFHAAVSAGAFTGGTGTTTIEHLPAERLRKIRFPFPSSDYQATIASFLDRETTRVDALIATKRRLLELLEEYRSALITSAVTGKIDVRGAGERKEAAE